MSFFIVILGMHSIQRFFRHEEINFDTLFEAMILHSNTISSSQFSVIVAGLWVIVDKCKCHILSQYVA